MIITKGFGDNQRIIMRGYGLSIEEDSRYYNILFDRPRINPVTFDNPRINPVTFDNPRINPVTFDN